MKKIFSKISLLWLVVAAIFNVIFFTVAGTEHIASVWIAYAFIQLSFLVAIVVPFVTRKSSSEASLAEPISKITSIYMIVEFVVGLIFIFAKAEDFKASLFIQLILFVIFVALLVQNISANKQTTAAIKKQKSEAAVIKINSAKVKSFIGMTNDRNVQKTIERAYDAIYYSPIESKPEASDVERAVNAAIDELERAVNNNNVEQIDFSANKIVNLMNQRNLIIKTLH